LDGDLERDLFDAEILRIEKERARHSAPSD
jgi:hypothetical protein